MTRIYFARDSAEAELIRGWLNERGISATVLGEPLSSAIGRLPMSAASPEIWVREEDAEAANAAMVKYEIEVHHPVPCSSCGFDMRDAAGPECPQCGTSSEQIVAAQRADWVCPGCGEKIEGQFSECWKCGGSGPKGG